MENLEKRESEIVEEAIPINKGNNLIPFFALNTCFRANKVLGILQIHNSVNQTKAFCQLKICKSLFLEVGSVHPNFK